MKTKIVYVLVSTDDDFYLENLLMSAYSLRQIHKEVKITVVTDDATYHTLNGKRAAIKALVDSFVQVKVPEYHDKRMTSRYLKVTLRRHIVGTYLFLDTDTIITGDISSIENCADDISMALDANSDRSIAHSEDKGDKWINNALEKVGWDTLDGEYHFNSGVIYAKDTPLVHKLYEHWHDSWLECARNDIYWDEPALSRAHKNTGRIIGILPNPLNWQIQRHSPKIPKGTLIIHYFSNCRNRSFHLAKDSVMIAIKENGGLTDSIIKYIKILQTILT